MEVTEAQNDKKLKEKADIKTERPEEKKSLAKKIKKKVEKLEEIKNLHKKEIEKLKEEIEMKGSDSRENHDKWLRLNADFENTKKRMQREKADFMKYAGERIIRDFLPIMDNLERAIKSEKENHKMENFIEGIEMVMNQIKSTLESNGAKQFDSLGRVFDPNHHEAVSKIPSEKHKNDTVIEELHKGYMFHDRLLRPAMVIVAENIKGEKDNQETKEREEKEKKDV